MDTGVVLTGYAQHFTSFDISKENLLRLFEKLHHFDISFKFRTEIERPRSNICHFVAIFFRLSTDMIYCIFERFNTNRT